MPRILGLLVSLATLTICLPAEAQVRSKAPGRIGIGSGSGRPGGTLLNRKNTLIRRSARPAVAPAPRPIIAPTVAPLPNLDQGDFVRSVGPNTGFILSGTVNGRPLVVGRHGLGTLHAGRYYPGSRYPFLDWYGHRYSDALVYNQPVPVIGYQYQVPIATGLPQAFAEPAPPPPTEMDLARSAMHDGSVDEAIERLRSYLDEHDTDAEAMRLLALALFDARRIEESVAMLAMAYETEPSLASRSLATGTLEGGEMDLRRRVRRAVQYANKPGASSSAWLMVVVLMQAEQRDSLAGSMLDRAEIVGLAEPVVEEFRTALR